MDKKTERLEAALRQNLQRRKQQQRDRDAAAGLSGETPLEPEAKRD